MKGDKSYYYTALVAFLLLRVFTFSYFSGNYTDSDQCVLWQTAVDFSQFNFYTPFFYGQHYSSGLEAWLAAPFLWLGIPVYRAVPLATALMSTLPWLWMAQLSIKRHGHTRNATALLMLSLIFPIEWLQISFISRGFIQSIFLTAMATRVVGTSVWRLNLAIFLVGWGLLQNMNGLLLLPAVWPYWRNHLVGNSITIRQLSQKIGLGALATLGIGFWLSQLKQTHPNWKTHSTVEMNQSLEALGNNLTNANTLFQHIYPLVPVLTMVLVGTLTWKFFKPENRTEKLALILTFIAPWGMFGVEKIADGTENVFFGYGRFFLAIPFAWGFIWSHNPFTPPHLTALPKPKLLLPLLFILGTVGYGYQLWKRTSLNVFGKSFIPVMIYPLNQMREDAKALAQLCEEQSVGAVVALDHYTYDCASMGYPNMVDFPLQNNERFQQTHGQIDTAPKVFWIHEPIPIVRPKFERRHWILPALKSRGYIPRRVAVMEVLKDRTWANSVGLPYQVYDVRGPVYLFETNDLTLTDFIELYLRINLPSN